MHYATTPLIQALNEYVPIWVSEKTSSRQLMNNGGSSGHLLGLLDGLRTETDRGDRIAKAKEEVLHEGMAPTRPVVAVAGRGQPDPLEDFLGLLLAGGYVVIGVRLLRE